MPLGAANDLEMPDQFNYRYGCYGHNPHNRKKCIEQISNRYIYRIVVHAVPHLASSGT